MRQAARRANHRCRPTPCRRLSTWRSDRHREKLPTGPVNAGESGGSEPAIGATYLEAHQNGAARMRTFKLSTVPKFAEKLKDVVGLTPTSAHAVVLGRREKPNPGTRPHPAGIADEAGPCQDDHYDYKRHGTTTLFAALNILDGTVIGRNMQRHRHQEFIRFLNTIEEQVPVGRVIQPSSTIMRPTSIQRCANGWPQSIGEGGVYEPVANHRPMNRAADQDKH